MEILSCRGVGYSSDATDILKGVDLSVRQGELVTILGPSGSGKTTLLRVLADLISPTTGEVMYKSKPVGDYEPIDYRTAVRYVPQAAELFAGTVRDNLAFVYQIHKQPYDETAVVSVLDDFGISEKYLDKSSAKLSGGEKQRIALARSLLFMPAVLLLDEPTSALDKKNLRGAEDVLLRYNKAGVTMVWVTHNESQSGRVASRVLEMNDGRTSEVNV